MEDETPGRSTCYEAESQAHGNGSEFAVLLSAVVHPRTAARVHQFEANFTKRRACEGSDPHRAPHQSRGRLPEEATLRLSARFMRCWMLFSRPLSASC